jgi:hypothetical protein
MRFAGTRPDSRLHRECTTERQLRESGLDNAAGWRTGGHARPARAALQPAWSTDFSGGLRRRSDDRRANLLGELVPTMAQLAIILLIVGVLAAFIGVAGLGIVTMNTRVLPRWCGVALVIFGFLGLPAMLSGGIAWALLGLPWVLVGYALFQAGARLSERPSRVR